MSSEYSAWHIDGDNALKRRVRIEVIGKTFTLYEDLWRSQPYYFGDLVYKDKQGDAHVYGLDDGLIERPNWRLGIVGDLPKELVQHIPPPKSRPALSGIGMIIIAAICLAIAYLVLATVD